MKFHDMAEKPMVETIAPGKEKQKYYPSFSVNEDQIPELKGKEVGGMCEIVIKASVKSIEQYKQGQTQYRLEIRKAAYKTSGKDNGEEY